MATYAPNAKCQREREYGWLTVVLMTLTCVLQMDDVFGEVVQSMPVQLVEPVERMINRDVRYRPTMQYFMAVSPSMPACPLHCMSTPSVLMSACFSPHYYREGTAVI